MIRFPCIIPDLEVIEQGSWGLESVYTLKFGNGLRKETFFNEAVELYSKVC